MAMWSLGAVGCLEKSLRKKDIRRLFIDPAPFLDSKCAHGITRYAPANRRLRAVSSIVSVCAVH